MYQTHTQSTILIKPVLKKSEFKSLIQQLKTISEQMHSTSIKTIVIEFTHDDCYSDICFNRILVSKEENKKTIKLNNPEKHINTVDIDDFAEFYTPADIALIRHLNESDIPQIAQNLADKYNITIYDSIVITKEKIRLKRKK